MANSFFNLSDLDGTNGFVLNTISTDNTSNLSVSNAGDVNGDGIDDVIIGANNGDPNGQSNAGESYVVFGSRDDFAATIDLSSLDGSNGFVINGIDRNDNSGTSVSSAGDINGDGIDDLIIGADSSNPNGKAFAGESYVIFGSNDGFEANVELSDLNGSNGFVINGARSFGFSGSSVSSAGDINGDGVDDLVIGAFFASSNGKTYTGESYVVFGSNDGFGESLELSNLDGENGFVISGMDSYDFLGSSVSDAGDINGDGFDDIIVGAIYGDPHNNSNAGESYVIFGSDQGFGANFDLSSLDGSNGFIINGIDNDDKSASSVSSAGDVNGDGFDDLIIAATYADPNGNGEAGESYVVFGSDQGFGATLELSSLDGSNGFVINGVDSGDQSGSSVSGAGDVNGDGIDDLIIGSKSADPNGNSQAGESYVVFGSKNGFGANLELSELDGTNGYIINGIDSNDQTGSSVSGAGDVNGDGIDDLIIGSNSTDFNEGESYVIFGRTNDHITNENVAPTAISLDNAIIADSPSPLTLSSNEELTVTVGENTISQSLDSYGNDSKMIQDTPDAVVTYHDNGNEVQIDNNGWKALDITNYNVTEDTLLRFQFRSAEEGEIHGIGVDNDDDLFNNTNSIFQLYGTQTFANQAFNDYQGLNDSQAVDGWKEYEISLGQYVTGDYDRLVVFTDNDTPNNLGGSSQFRNIVLEEAM